MTSRVQIDDGIIRMSFDPMRRVPAFLLGVFSVGSFLFPLGITIYVLIAGWKLPLAIIITYLLFWGVGFFALRLVLWNLNGADVILLERNKLTYYTEFKWFKERRTCFMPKHLCIEATDVKSNSSSTLLISNDKKSVETVVSLSPRDIITVISAVKSFYQLHAVNVESS